MRQILFKTGPQYSGRPTEVEIICKGQKNWKPSFNIAPSQMATVITSDRPDHINIFHFGLVPHWAKDKEVGYKMINARSETLLEKPSFKPLLVNKKDA